MKLLYFIIAGTFLCHSCSTTQSTKQIDYLGEKGVVEYYNLDKTQWPIAVIIPAVFNSLLQEKELERLAKGKRLVVIRFLSYEDKIRAMQVDGMERRVNYYSDVINQSEQAYGKISFLVAEGLNATVGAKLITNYNFDKAVFINAWNPSIKMQLITNCYASPNSRCDSLASYLNIGSKNAIEELLKDVETGIDRLYGHYNMRMWQQMIDYRMDDFLLNKRCPVHWIYTTQSGLMEKEKADASPNIDLYTIKEFRKVKNVISN